METSPIRFMLCVFSTHKSFPLNITYPEPAPCLVLIPPVYTFNCEGTGFVFPFFVVYRDPVILMFDAFYDCFRILAKACSQKYAFCHLLSLL